MKARLTIATLFIIALGFSQAAFSQQQRVQKPVFPYSNKFSLGGGLSQLLLGGFNVQAEYTTNRFVFDYSHGFNLHFEGKSASLVAQDQHLKEKLTSTLGLGVGYRIMPAFDVRFEPKLHYYEVGYDQKIENQDVMLAKYKTVTLGVGAYYRYYPFRRQESALAGILILPSVRYWPNVWSSLDDDKLTYVNKISGKTETYKAAPQGFPGTKGLLANVTVAYTFNFRKPVSAK